MKIFFVILALSISLPAHAVMFNKEHIKFCDDYKAFGDDWLALAKDGYVEYQFKLGDLWRIRSTRHEGYFVTHTVYCPLKHSPEFWMRKAAENGHPDAQFGLAKILIEKLQNKVSSKDATLPFDVKCEAEREIRHFLALADKQGHKTAATTLGLVYGGYEIFGDLCVENGREMCAKLLNKQAVGGESIAQETLSGWYGHSLGCVNENQLVRLLWLNVIATNGQSWAVNQMNVPVLNVGNDHLKPSARRLAKECLRTNYQNCDTSKEIIILPEQRPE